MRFVTNALVLASIAFAASSCGGGSASATLPNTTSTLAPGGSVATARVVIVVPAQQAPASSTRAPQYVSASTQSITVQVDAGTPTVQNLTPSSPNCTPGGSGVTCTVTIVATSASHLFTFTTYDLINAGGNALSVNSVTQTLVAGALTNVNVTLAGIPKTMTITALPLPSIVGNSTSGFQFASAVNQTLVVDALDADGDIILGPGAPILAANATSVQTGSGISVAPVGGNPNEFTVSSTGFGTATFSASATPTSALAGAGINATAALSATTITTTLAGTLNTSGSADGTGTAALFYNPSGITYDPSTGYLYVTDTANYTIRQLTTAGVVTTLAGAAGFAGFTDGTGTAAKFSSNPIGSIVYAASTGAFYVGDTNNCAIRKVTTSGVVTTIVGVPPTPPCGYLDGNTSTALAYLTAMTFDSSNGNLYSADRYNCAVRQVATTGTVSTIAGAYHTATCAADVDATGTSARFNGPSGIAYDSGDGDLYVVEGSGCTVRRVTPLGVVTTIAGSNGLCSILDGTGSAARLNAPKAITYDSDNGNLYITDSCEIRQVTTSGVVTTVAGSGSCTSSVDGVGTNAIFNGAPSGLVYVPGSSTLYVTDLFGQAIRKVQI